MLLSLAPDCDVILVSHNNTFWKTSRAAGK